ncbi:MAG: porin family protein [Chitinophagaceae bacterium]|nr:porin family protein [Chitinophagaceae bacterium]
MKKFLILVFVLALHQAGQSQISYGAKAGLNLASIAFSSEDYTTSMKPGFHAGGFVQYSLKDKLGIQAEVVYSAEGNKWIWKPNATKATINTSHIRIPLMVQYKIGNGILVEAGPQYRLLLTIKQTALGATHDIKPLYYGGTFGVGVGAAYELPGKIKGLKAGVRYSRDLSKMNKQNVGGGNLTGSVIAISVQYQLSK